MSSTASLVLTGGTIYVSPKHDAVLDGVVFIERGKIAGVGSSRAVTVPRGTEILDWA